jgi:hypothetical protein
MSDIIPPPVFYPLLEQSKYSTVVEPGKVEIFKLILFPLL